MADFKCGVVFSFELPSSFLLLAELRIIMQFSSIYRLQIEHPLEKAIGNH